jgi:hypothetical protein
MRKNSAKSKLMNSTSAVPGQGHNSGAAAKLRQLVASYASFRKHTAENFVKACRVVVEA